MVFDKTIVEFSTITKELIDRKIQFFNFYWTKFFILQISLKRSNLFIEKLLHTVYNLYKLYNEAFYL